MFRRIFKTGNSFVISIPREILEQLDISEGEKVSVILDQKQHQIIISPVDKPLAASLNEEFSRQVSDFIKEYHLALDALAK